MIQLRRFLSILLASVVMLVSAGPVFAQTTPNQTANGFRISPVRNELSIDKGKSQTVSIFVENPSTIPLKSKAVINDFVASDNEDGQPQLLLDGTSAPSHSLRKLIQDVPVIDLAGNERKEVRITVSIPASAAAGGYYGAVRFVPENAKSSANVALTASVGSIFLVNVPGNIKEHLELVQFSAAVNGSARKLITGGQVSVITRLKNDGDTHEKPYGKIQVKDSHNKVVAEAEINNIEPQSNVLPSSIRKFETQLKNKKWFGHYTITASLGYNPSNNELINASTSFWYIPVWLLILMIAAVLAVLALGYVMYRKMLSKRSKHSHKKTP